MIGVEQWAEIRRLYFVEKRSKRAIHRLTGAHRDTITRAIESPVPPRYARPARVSKLDPFRDWICEQLRADPSIESQRLREMAGELGYQGGKSIFDDFVREVRPRYLRPRTFQRTIYRPGELVQCDLWEPAGQIPVGHGQLRRGWVVTCEVCWSRAIAGTLIFSKEAPDILWGLARNLQRLGGLPEKLVWDREAAIAAGGRPTDAFAAFCGQLEVGWVILEAMMFRIGWMMGGWSSTPRSRRMGTNPCGPHVSRASWDSQMSSTSISPSVSIATCSSRPGGAP